MSFDILAISPHARFNERVAALATALALAPVELINREKALTATIPS